MGSVKCYVSSMDKTYVLTPVAQGDFLAATHAPDENTIVLDPTKKGQPILGFGANWTDTDFYNLTRMSPAQQDLALEKLFDPEKGAGWNFMRVPFGSTDWERNFDFYSYDDMPEGEKDWELKNFSVQKDVDRGFFAMLRRVKERYPDVKLLASVWGLPGWMKNNDSLLGGIFMPEYTDVYARYLRMAVQAYQEQGIDLYSITVQNEPKSSDFPNYNRGTPATRMTWRLQKGVLIALAREFKDHNIDTKIWTYDHNFDMVEIFVDPILADEEARAVIDGVAFHPYRGDPAVMGKYEALYPDMPLYSTEKTVSDPAGMDEMLRQLRYGARTYILWSFFADSYGGPHQGAGNAFQYTNENKRSMLYNHPLSADQWDTSGAYGLFAQFSKFLKRGMRRIDCTYGHKKWITATAFQADDGQIALVVVNQTNAEQSFKIQCGSKSVCAHVPGMAAATCLIEPDAAMLDGSVKVEDAPAKSFYEAPAWDLSPTDFYFDQPCKAGEEIRFKVKIANVGEAPTIENTTVVVDILLDGDYRIGKVYATVPVLQPGEDVEFTARGPVYDASGTGCKSTWTATPGWHDIMAFMQVGNCYQKENPYNNRCSKEFFFA